MSMKMEDTERVANTVRKKECKQAVNLVNDSYFLNRRDYKFRPFTDGGLSGNKQLAVPKKGNGASYVIKGGSRECACNEFIGLRLAKLMGVNVPNSYLVSPKEDRYAVAIEYLTSQPKPTLEKMKDSEQLLHAYVYGVIAHCLFEDRDKTDFLFSDGILFTFDFAEGFRSSDFSIMVMEYQEQLSHLFSPNLVDQLATSSLDYYPSTLAAYELLVNDQQVCDKAYFDAALDDMCSRFLSIPNEEIESMLNALGSQYPAALIDHFKRYIEKIREFCQE